MASAKLIMVNSLQCTSTSRWLICGPKFVTWPGKVWWGYSHYSPEVIRVQTLHFKPNFKFSRLKFLEDPIPVVVCASKSCQSVTRIKFWDFSPEVLFAHTLNFKPNFKFSRLNFFGGPRPSWGVRYQALLNLYSARKNLWAQHPLRAEIWYPKKWILVGNKKAQQIWQTSALAMHLPLAR